MLLKASMCEVMVLGGVSRQTLAVIEPAMLYFCVTLPWCGSFWYPGRSLHIGCKSKDAAVGAHRSLCKRDSVRSVLSTG